MEGEVEAVALVHRGGAMSPSPLLMEWIDISLLTEMMRDEGEGAGQGVCPQGVGGALFAGAEVVLGEIEIEMMRVINW